ncbi:MAG: NAD kinase [Burkholderiaceae bacterium]
MPSLTVAIVGKFQAEGIAASLLEIAGIITDAGHRVVIDRDTAHLCALKDYPALSYQEIGHQASAAIVVGGDGTMLGIARQLAPYNVPLIGINQGRLGFMTDISLDAMVGVLTEMLAGRYEVDERAMLAGSIHRAPVIDDPTSSLNAASASDRDEVFRALALNDIVVSRGAGSGMVELTVDVDGRFMYSQRSDGLIVSTPTGSTAYALSANGPIMHPGLCGFLMVPIAPHSLSNRPIALPDSCRIDITVTGGRDVSANFDMQSFAALRLGDRISIERAPMTIRFLHPIGYSYFATLRQKLHWNEPPLAMDGRLVRRG